MSVRKLLFFHAPWCPLCKFYEQEFITAVESDAGQDRIERINVQESPFAAEEYLIDRLPYVIFLDGELVYRRNTGAIDINKTIEWLKGG